MTGIKDSIRSAIIRGVNSLQLSSRYIGTPKGWITVTDWVAANRHKEGVFYQEIFSARSQQHQLPSTIDKTIHKAYLGNVSWQQPAAYVAGIPGGRVWGRNGAVISPDDLLLDDVSREFGKREGVFNKEHSIFKQIKLARVQKIKGTVAVIAAAGSATYYHWLFDILPRIGLLKEANLFDQVDYFVIDDTGLPFQKESLGVLGIPPHKVLKSNDHWKFHIEAERLLVPSLTGRLSTISDWTIGFLRNTFLNDQYKAEGPAVNIYLSRKKAPTRKLINEAELEEQVLKPGHFLEFFAEDYSIRSTAATFANARYVMGVHGSGFANLAFCSPGTKVIDIVAPRHVGPYFWFLTDYTQSAYGYIFGQGDRAMEEEDLIRNKVDHDIQLDVGELKSLMHKMESRQLDA